ncbi:hypothetical protein BU23DRAFT_298859 [Bimuria novae-zelandiae CBS 107.79]|uniref:Uncharacterized protein n=1 Tax=Bimuria novae-zelandiae CBS 107.79 TaxID=1447943 RepID=A0A6A5VRN6_9PLEO|nr:hypothetical protein BU23DRAFT_298859 [Bimuria novae-zelandiae CBS 107.79]
MYHIPPTATQYFIVQIKPTTSPIRVHLKCMRIPVTARNNESFAVLVASLVAILIAIRNGRRLRTAVFEKHSKIFLLKRIAPVKGAHRVVVIAALTGFDDLAFRNNDLHVAVARLGGVADRRLGHK